MLVSFVSAVGILEGSQQREINMSVGRAHTHTHVLDTKTCIVTKTIKKTRPSAAVSAEERLKPTFNQNPVTVRSGVLYAGTHLYLSH